MLVCLEQRSAVPIQQVNFQKYLDFIGSQASCLMIIFETKLTVIFSGKCGYFDVAVISVSVKGFSAAAVSSQEPILGLFTLFQKRLCCSALLDRAAPSHSLPCSRSQAAPALMHTPGQETHVQLITNSTIVDHGLTGCTLDQMNCPHNIH